MTMSFKKECCALLMLYGIMVFAGNLVKNGDFTAVDSKNQFSSWSPQSWGPPTGKIFPDRETFAGEAPSLCIENTLEKQQTFLAQAVKLNPNTEYKISYFIKGENIKGNQPFCGGAVYLLDKGNSLFSMGTGLYRHATGTFDWKRVEHTFRTKALQAEKVELLFSLRSVTGKVWFDDVRIECVTKQTDSPLTAFLYPVDYQNRTFFLCKDFPAALLLNINLDRKVIPDNFLQMVLDLPEGVEYQVSCALLAVRNAKNELVFEKDSFEKSVIRRDGVKYNRYILNFAPSFTIKLNRTQAWENYNRIYLKSSAEPGTSGKVYWRLRSKSHTFPEQSFRLTTLPPLELPSKACERFQLCIARPWNMNTLPEISSGYVRLWTSLQKHPWISDPYYINVYPESEKRKIFDNFHYSSHLASARSMPWLGSLYDAVAKNRFPGKIPPAIGIDGKAFPVTVSPWYLIEDPENLIWGKLFDEYAEQIKKNPHVKSIAIDYEPGALTHCFSDESRKRFAAFAKLSAVPSTQEIIAKYRAEWLKFRVEQHRLIIQRLSRAIRSKLPGIEFWLISDPLQTGKQRVAEWCGVDVKASDPDIDLHQDMPYFAGLPFFETMKLNISTLEKPCFPFIDPSENLAMYYSRYTPETVKQNILIVAALGGYGIGFWPNDVFDGRYLEAIKEGYRVVAGVEDFYADPALPENSFKAVCRNVMEFDAAGSSGESVKLTIPQLDRKIRVLRHRRNGTELLTLFNFSDTLPAIVELALPDADGDFYSAEELAGRVQLAEHGKIFSGGRVREGFLREVPPNGTAVVRLARERESKIVKGGCDQKDLRLKLEKIATRYAQQSQVKPYRSQDSAVRWGLLPDDDKAILFLEQGTARIGIAALDGGEIVAWQPEGGSGSDALYHHERGFLGRFTLNSPEQLAGPYPFELQSIMEKNGDPAVSFGYTVPDFANASAVKNPLAGLRIEDETALSENGRKIVRTYRFTNPGKEPMRFSFKLNNFPKIGSRFAGKEPLTGLTRISCGTLSFVPGVPKNDRLFLASPDAAPELRRHLVFGRMPVEKVIPGPVAVEAGKGMRETLRIIPDGRTAGFYSWANLESGYTVEPVSEMLELPAGKTLVWRCTYQLK